VKKILLAATIVSCFSAASAETIIFQENSGDQAVKFTIMVQAGNPRKQTLRKVSPATILNGVANSCTQLGKVAGAKDKQEKQQKTCNFIASFFQLAADAAKEHAESKKEKAEKQEPAQEKKGVTAQTVDLTLELIDIIEKDTENELKSEPTLYLSMLKNIPNKKTKREIIEQILSDEKEADSFLEEVVATLQKVFTQSIPSLANDLLISLKNLFGIGEADEPAIPQA
jgi:hypothetical protein